MLKLITVTEENFQNKPMDTLKCFTVISSTLFCEHFTQKDEYILKLENQLKILLKLKKFKQRIWLRSDKGHFLLQQIKLNKNKQNSKSKTLKQIM